MVMNMLREGAKGGIGKFILVGFMGLAVGGLVFMDMGGFFRGGLTGADAIRIGDEKVSINQFDRSVRQALRPLGISVQDAYRLGYIDQVAKTEIRTRLINQAARDLGILISDEHVAAHIKKLVAPLVGEDGNTKQILEKILFNQGMSEAEFVRAIKQDMAGSLLTGALQAGFTHVDEDMAKFLYKHQYENRTAEYIVLPRDEITLDENIDEQDIRHFYEINREAYAVPERRVFTVLTVDQDSLAGAFHVDDERLKTEYEDNIDLYKTPAQWTLEQAILTEQEDAQSVFDAMSGDPSLEKAVREVTGNTNAYLGAREFFESTLPEALKDTVTEAKSGDILGPVSSPLGWYVVRVSSAEAAYTKPFEEVKEDIAQELKEADLLDTIYAQADAIDDMLAGGATPEEVAGQATVTLTTLDPVDSFGRTEAEKDGLKAFADFRQRILKEGFTLGSGETTPVQETKNGQFVAMHAAQIIPKQYKPFETVQDTVLERWQADQKRIRNKTNAYQILKELETMSLSDLARRDGKIIKTVHMKSREEPYAPHFSANATRTVFAAPLNTPVIIRTDEGLLIAAVTDVKWPEKVDDSAYEKLKSDISLAQQNEAVTLYLTHKQKKYGTKVNRRLITRLYGMNQDANQ